MEDDKDNRIKYNIKEDEISIDLFSKVNARFSWGHADINPSLLDYLVNNYQIYKNIPLEDVHQYILKRTNKPNTTIKIPESELRRINEKFDSMPDNKMTEGRVSK